MPAPTTPHRSSALSTPNTGSWRHPAMDTIIERSKHKGATDLNLNRLSKNVFALFASYALIWFLQKSGYDMVHGRHPAVNDLLWLGGYTLNVLRLLFIYNILESGYRLTRKEPDFSDLALTPMQRKLLGLPNVQSNIPTSGYITPPRYSKSSPAASPSPAAAIASSSPSSSSFNPTRSISPIRRPTTTNEPPMTPSPLRNGTRGHTSYFSHSLGFSISSGSSVTSTNAYQTPSPIGRIGGTLGPGGSGGGGSAGRAGEGERLGLPVGNRWIYEKMGRRGEGLRFTPGRNAVFSPMKPGKVG